MPLGRGLWVTALVPFCLVVLSACTMPGNERINIDSDAMNEKHEQDVARARETCVLVPPDLARQLADGIEPFLPGGYLGRPGDAMPVDHVYLRAYRWPPSAHIVEASVVLKGEKMSSVRLTFLVDGDLDEPESIEFVVSPDHERAGLRNATSFDMQVLSDVPWEPLWHCGEIGAVAGPISVPAGK